MSLTKKDLEQISFIVTGAVETLLLRQDKQDERVNKQDERMDKQDERMDKQDERMDALVASVRKIDYCLTEHIQKSEEQYQDMMLAIATYQELAADRKEQQHLVQRVDHLEEAMGIGR